MQVDRSNIKDFVGKRLYWDEESPRWIFIRGGVLDTPYRGQICFDGSGDYYPLSHYKNLRTTYDKDSQ